MPTRGTSLTLVRFEHMEVFTMFASTLTHRPSAGHGGTMTRQSFDIKFIGYDGQKQVDIVVKR
jgi:hypothetical protein